MWVPWPSLSWQGSSVWGKPCHFLIARLLFSDLIFAFVSIAQLTGQGLTIFWAISVCLESIPLSRMAILICLPSFRTAATQLWTRFSFSLFENQSSVLSSLRITDESCEDIPFWYNSRIGGHYFWTWSHGKFKQLSWYRIGQACWVHCQPWKSEYMCDFNRVGVVGVGGWWYCWKYTL